MKYEIKQSLEGLLGVGRKTAKNNMAYACPFKHCKSHGTDKRKLEISLDTGQWHCWVCNARGKTIESLFNTLNAKYTLDFSATKSVNTSNLFSEKSKETSISLPKEFKSLHSGSLNFYGKKALAYLHSRDITDDDIITYNIGYCEYGIYDGYIVIPNYDKDGILNYFTTRTFLPNRKKTRNPTVERKNIIGFELQLNWNLPIIFVESALNAVTVKYNASPLYGSHLTSPMIRKLYEKEVSEVIFCWDGDAYEKSKSTAKILTANGIKVKVVRVPEEEDANSLGHDEIWNLIDNTTYSSHRDLEFDSIYSKLL